MSVNQLPLFSEESLPPSNHPFPSTRYQGSKRTLVDWIWNNVAHLTFETVLDVFGGTGVVSHRFKTAGKSVTYNDLLAFNWNIGLALIENCSEMLSSAELDMLLDEKLAIDYPDFVARHFHDIYFTDEENVWLDRMIFRINHLLNSPYKKALARFALFQAAIAKRPYNLFHRANLYMRTAQVERSFGNKTTWDFPFEKHFLNFVAEANRAVFSNGRDNKAINVDALQTPQGADLVYIDPPYLNNNGVGVDYRDFYHFLEGIVFYEQWGELIDMRSKHRRLHPQPSPWNSAASIANQFDQLFRHHQQSIMVVSYRDDGVPTKTQLIDLLKRYKPTVYEASLPKKYVLSHAKSHEILLIAP